MDSKNLQDSDINDNSPVYRDIPYINDRQRAFSNENSAKMNIKPYVKILIINNNPCVKIFTTNMENDIEIN